MPSVSKIQLFPLVITSLLCLASCSSQDSAKPQQKEVKTSVGTTQKLLSQAKTAVEQLEQTPTADLVPSTFDLVNQLPDSDDKTALLQRLETVKQAIEMLATAQASVDQLETNQTREQLDATSQLVHALPESEQKTTLNNRVAAVSHAIAAREEQERLAAEEQARIAAEEQARIAAEEQARIAAEEQARVAAEVAQAAPAAATSAYYPNCSAVRAAGVAPLYQGQPGYSSHLDRDGDGVACE